MIITAFEGEGRSANVCLHDSTTWVVMCYENEQYKKYMQVLDEDTAEILAENWIEYIE